MGLGMPIPDLSNKPGPGRPGYPTGAFEFKLQIEGTGAFTFTGSKAGGSQNFSIDWGDGTSASGLTGTSHTHTYSTAGPHVLMINNEEDSGPINVFQITAGETLVTKVLNWGTTAWNNLTAAFSGCTNLTTLEDSALITDSNGDLYDCFNGCTGLTTVNGKKWNLSAGARIGRWFNGCTNVELLDLTGVSLNLIEASDDAFQSAGSATTNGCEFKLSGITLTQPSSLSHDDWFRSTKIKPTSTFANITWPSNYFNGLNWFYEAVVTGANSTLNCSGWSTFDGTLSGWFSRLNNVGGGLTPSNTNLKVDLTNFSGKTASINGLVSFSAISGLIGLSTWGSTDFTPIDFSMAFYAARVFAMDANDNFSNTFISSCNVSGISNFYRQTGNDYNGTLVYGAAPNLTNLDCSSVASFARLFEGAKLTSNPDFNSITYPSTAVSFNSAFSEIRFQTYSGSHIDFSSATLKISDLGSAFRGYGTSVVEKLTFGNNVDFSQLTSFSQTFYNFGRGVGGTEITLPTNADYGALTNVSNMFFNTNFPYTIPALNTCQVNYFIRNLYSSRQSLGSGGAFTINMPGMSITEAPSLVRSTLDDLTALGYNITLGATDATLPFAYASYAVDPTGITTISPTTTPPAGSVFTATNSLSINSSTGVITINSFRGGSTIRCTYPDGCYNEVVMLIQVPFVMRTVIPGLVGSTTYLDMEVKPQMSAGECFVDWGDSNSETLTGNTTHTYAAAGTYDIKIFDSPNGSKFENFSGYFPVYTGINSATYGSTYDIDIIQWGEIQWKNPSTSGQGWFALNQNQKSYIELAAASNDAPDLSQATSLRKMFGTSGGGAGQSDIARFTDPNDSMRSWNTSTITDMSEMWKAKLTDSSLSLDLSQWNVSNVETFASMFDAGSANQQSSIGALNISGWNSQSATNMNRMFYRTSATSITGLGDLNTSLVTTMSQMFNNCPSGVVGQASETLATKMVSGILRWDVNNVVNFNNMFQDADQLSDTSFPTNWNITSDASKTVSMSTMFGGTPAGLTNTTNLDAFATKTISETWYGGTSYTAWNMSRVSSLSQFAYASGGAPIARNYNIASWQISSALTNMFYMFGGKNGGNGSIWQQDVGHWNVSGLDDGPSKVSYWLSARNGSNPPNIGRTIYDSILDVTDGWGSQTGTAGFPTNINWQNGTSKFTGNNVAIGTATVNGTSTNLIAGGSPFSSSMVGGIVTLTSGTNSGQQAKITTFNSASSVTISRAINLQAEQNTFTVDTTDAAKGRFALSDPDGPAWIITDGGKEVPFDPLKLQVRVPANSSLAFSFAKITSPSNVNATLKWGDGQESTINTVNSIPTHTYTNNTGSDVDYELELNQGSDSVYCTGFRFDDNLDATSRAAVRNLTQWGDTSWVSMASAFKTCSNFDITATDGPVITSSTSFTHTFGSCTSLVNSNGSMGNWDVSQLTGMYATFDNCTSFNVDISKWDTSSLGNLYLAFLGATSFNQDLSTKYITAGNSPTGSAYWAWKTNNVSNAASVFKNATSFNCGSNANGLSNWNTSNITTMQEMFENSAYNKPLNTNLVPAASSYSGSDYVAWDVDNVVDFREMFRDNTSFNQDIGKWKFKSTGTIAFNYMLKGATAFAQDISTKTITAGNSPYGTQYTAWDVSRANSLTRVIAGTNVNVLLNWSVGQWSTYALHSWGGASAAGGLSVANYTDQIVKWANDVNAAGKTPTGIYAVVNSDGATVPNYDSTRTYGSGFANAGRARSYLSLDVTVSGSGDSSINGVYYYDYANSKWVRENDANIQIAWNGDESVWEISVEGEATNSGSGGSQAGGPTSVTSWSGGITVADSSAGWTFNGTVTT